MKGLCSFFFSDIFFRHFCFIDRTVIDGKVGDASTPRCDLLDIQTCPHAIRKCVVVVRDVEFGYFFSRL